MANRTGPSLSTRIERYITFFARFRANVADGAGTSNNFADSDAAFKEKLRNMGKVSKKKFTQLARLFSGRTKKNFKQLDDSTSRDPYMYEDLNDSLRHVNSAGGSSREGERTRKANVKFWSASIDQYKDLPVNTCRQWLPILCLSAFSQFIYSSSASILDKLGYYSFYTFP